MYSSKSGKLLWTADGGAGNRLGTSLEAAGDTNKDGVPDVVATAGGGVRTYPGDTGTLLRTIAPPGATPLVSSAGAGDVNGDGYADIISGSTTPPGPPPAPGTTPAPQSPGAAYVFSGKDAAVLLTVAGGARWRSVRQRGRRRRREWTNAADRRGAAGMFVAVAGDVDGDGVCGRVCVRFRQPRERTDNGTGLRALGKDGRLLRTITSRIPEDTLGFDSVGSATSPTAPSIFC